MGDKWVDNFIVCKSCQVVNTYRYVCAIRVDFPSCSIRLRGNVIRDNHVGSLTGTLISRGIQLEGTDGTVVENNHIENARLAQKDNNNTYWVFGINAFYRFSTIIRSNGAQLEAIAGSGGPRRSVSVP